MRYTVRVAKKDGIKNIYQSDDYSSALAIEKTAREIYGQDNVWIADSILEILVG